MKSVFTFLNNLKLEEEEQEEKEKWRGEVKNIYGGRPKREISRRQNNLTNDVKIKSAK